MATSPAERRQQLLELLDYPRENLGVEIKNWLDIADPAIRAHVGRELLALGNSGGGFLIFGFDERNGGYAPATPKPGDLSVYGQDAMNSIVARYAEPRFEVAVEFVTRSDGQSTHPVVIVPGDLDTPIRAGRDGPERQHIAQNTYYIRRPGPESAPIQTGREWDELLERCIRTKREVLIDRIREIIEGPEALLPESGERAADALDDFAALALQRFEQVAHEGLPEGYPGRYAHGFWHLAYRVLGDVTSLSLGELRATLEKVVGHETGWPAWWLPTMEENAPHPWDGRIECWMAAGTFLDAAHSDYWLADRSGMLFLLRGYDDDSGRQGAPTEPGRYMDITLPVWRLGDCLLHAERFAAAASPMRVMMPRPNGGQDSVESRVTIAAVGLSERLPEVVQALTRPLYESFDFFVPPAAFFREELDALRGRGRR
jgi:hypothetical protein